MRLAFLFFQRISTAPLLSAVLIFSDNTRSAVLRISCEFMIFGGELRVDLERADPRADEEDREHRRKVHLAIDGSTLRRRMNIELKFSPNFEGLVLGCIDADSCK